MKPVFSFIGVGLALCAVLLVGSMFTVQEGTQALVVRFGDVRQSITQTGLFFRLPFIDDVVVIDKRILSIETNPSEIIASDQKRFVADAFVRYRVIDPIIFFKTLGNQNNANDRIRRLLTASMNSVLAKEPLRAVLSEKRTQLMTDIQAKISQETQELGIEVVDVRILRADLPSANSEAVYRRMQAERKRQADQFRAEGSEQSRIIKSKAEKEVIVLLANAQKDAESIRGDGDANRNRIFATAFSQDADFFHFYRSLEAYKNTLTGSDTRWILSKDSEFLKMFSKPALSHIRPVGGVNE